MRTALELIAQHTEAMRGLALKAEEGSNVEAPMRELIRTAAEQFRRAGDGSDAIESTRAMRARLVLLMESSDERQIRFRVAIEHAVSLLDQA